MTYVSTKSLSKKVLKRIGDLLITEIAKAKTISQARSFVDALLTDSERIMLAKRFTVVVLLEEGAHHRYIRNVLKISSATVFRIQRLRKDGVFDDLIECTYKKQKRQKNRNNSRNYSRNQETALEVLVRAGLPPMGRGRWRTLYRLTEDIKKK